MQEMQNAARTSVCYDNFIHAACSLDVYRDIHNPPLPDGWSILTDCPPEYHTDGYFGAAYVRATDSSKKNYEVIIAHRGTHSWIDGIEDFLILLGRAPLTFANNVLPFTAYVYDYLKKNFAHCAWTITGHTGHSLGAVLAELAAADAITFDSPGSVPIMQHLITHKKLAPNALDNARENIVTYFAEVNAINTCNAQIYPHARPRFFAPYIYPHDYQIVDISFMPGPDHLEYFFNFTIENQHQMINFYYYFKNIYDKKNPVIFNNAKMKQNFVWPVGFENGYRYYLTYDNHPEYWNGYTENLWKNNPGIHEAYKNNHENFRQDYLAHYLNSSAPLICLTPETNWENAEQIAMEKADVHRKLYIAVMTNNFALAENCITEGADINSTHGKKKYSLLHIAILCGNFDIMNLLLKHCANVHYANTDGHTALHLAVKNRHGDRLKYLENIFSAILKF